MLVLLKQHLIGGKEEREDEIFCIMIQKIKIYNKILYFL
jgi:hypothetical protein